MTVDVFFLNERGAIESRRAVVTTDGIAAPSFDIVCEQINKRGFDIGTTVENYDWVPSHRVLRVTMVVKTQVPNA